MVFREPFIISFDIILFQFNLPVYNFFNYAIVWILQLRKNHIHIIKNMRLDIPVVLCNVITSA